MGWKTSTAKFAWKIVKPFVLIWLIWSITGYVSAKGTGLFLVHVQPWQAAVQQGNFSGGLSEHDLAPGLHVNIPGFDSVHVVDMGRRMTSFGVDSDTKSLNAIDLRTSDDNVVALSTAILWKVKPGTAHSIVARALVETLPTQVALTAAEVLRREFASMGSEAWFDADGRVLLTSQIEPKLAAELAALHVDLDGIYIQGFAFSNDKFGINPLSVAHPLGKDLVMSLNPLAGLFAHNFSNTDPVIEFLRWNHRENLDPHAGVLRPHGRKAHRVQTFRGIVQYNHKFTHHRPPFDPHHARSRARPQRQIATAIKYLNYCPRRFASQSP